MHAVVIWLGPVKAMGKKSVRSHVKSEARCVDVMQGNSMGKRNLCAVMSHVMSHVNDVMSHVKPDQSTHT